MMTIEQKSYQVLARKYRPKTFDELVGQEVLVKTLTNAINSKKIAHAFVLTGIRGVGKTTAARIIAKALNCLGEDNSSVVARVPCGVCSNCLLIGSSKFQDVIEIDAASRTGVDDIREIIDSIGYAPAIGRYKTYIIDEVHMLSNNAFNALLKTLEEPPAHVKFIFATTEIRKVPITVLSRCQRFDLRRLEVKELSQHLSNVLAKEGFKAELEALDLIARAADGSVRDSLSIVDRALSCNNYQDLLTSRVVEDILNITDKSKVIELFESLLLGKSSQAIKNLSQFYENSCDLVSLLQDLLEVNHVVTLCKVVPNYIIEGFGMEQQTKIIEMANGVLLGSLAKIWQMLIKGSSEIGYASNQKSAFEMLLIRICYLSELPNLDRLIDQARSKNQLSESDVKQEYEVSEKNRSSLIKEVTRNFPNARIVS